jgi:hypothetical protein
VRSAHPTKIRKVRSAHPTRISGDPRHPPSGLKGDDYMTDAERQEALTIARSLFNDEYIKTYLENKRQNNLQPQINS